MKKPEVTKSFSMLQMMKLKKFNQIKTFDGIYEHLIKLIWWWAIFNYNFLVNVYVYILYILLSIYLNLTSFIGIYFFKLQ